MTLAAIAVFAVIVISGSGRDEKRDSSSATPTTKQAGTADDQCVRRAKIVEDYDILVPGASREEYLTLLHRMQAYCPEQAEASGLIGAGLKQCEQEDQENCTMYRG